MKKVLLTAIITLALSNVAMAKDGGYYAGAAYAIQSVAGTSAGSALVFTGGKALNEKLDFEVEMSQQLTSPTINTVDVEVSTFGAYGVYKHKVDEKLSVRARAGLVRENITLSAGTLAISGTSIGLSYGAQAAYKLSESLAVFADYTILSSSISHLGAGARFKF